MKSIKQHGFSLVELLVVVAIVGILAAAGIFSYTKYIYTSKVAVLESNMFEIANVIESEVVRPTICIEDAEISTNLKNMQNLFLCIGRIIESSKLTNPFTKNPYIIDHFNITYVNLDDNGIIRSQPAYDALNVAIDDPRIKEIHTYGNCESMGGSALAEGGIALIYQYTISDPLTMHVKTWLGACLNSTNSSSPFPGSQIITKITKKLSVSNI
jgi:prepilin-type N-terminal cleavage/methylation domain-containing protein